MPSTAPAATPIDLSTIASIVQIAFWMVLGALAILTYLNARKVLFQPQRTELLKLQLAELIKVIRVFENHSERALLNAWDAANILCVNATFMYDQYRLAAFGTRIDPAQRIYNTTECPQCYILDRAAHSDHIIGSTMISVDLAEPLPSLTTPTLTHWPQYRSTFIHLTRKHFDYCQQLTSLTMNPLLPTTCIRRIGSYYLCIAKAVELLQTIIDDAAKEMPARYPTAEHFEDTDVGWIRKRYFAALTLTPFQPHAVDITGSIRDYYGTSDLLQR